MASCPECKGEGRIIYKGRFRRCVDCQPQPSVGLLSEAEVDKWEEQINPDTIKMEKGRNRIRAILTIRSLREQIAYLRGALVNAEREVDELLSHPVWDREP